VADPLQENQQRFRAPRRPGLEIDARNHGLDELHGDAGGRLGFLAHRAAQVVDDHVRHGAHERHHDERDHEVDAKAQAHVARPPCRRMIAHENHEADLRI
jgi:hypothetical protein